MQPDSSDGRFAQKENDSIRFSTNNFSLLILIEFISEPVIWQLLCYSIVLCMTVSYLFA